MTQKTFKANWQDCLCDDLQPVMQHLQEKYHITGWRADTDLQQRWSRIYLSKNPSRKLIARVKEQFANSPQVLFLDMEIRCATHQVGLLPRRVWAIEHGINRQSLASFLVDMFFYFLFVISGVYMIITGDQEGSTKDIMIGLTSILLFGLAFGIGIKDLIQHIRKK